MSRAVGSSGIAEVQQVTVSTAVHADDNGPTRLRGERHCGTPSRERGCSEAIPE
jgi:hypothetical protein